VKYDLGINFYNTNSGELIQHIQLSENLSSFSGNYISEWLKSIERQSKKLQGSAQRISPTEIIVKIPFTNSRELQEKFNLFFNNYSQDKQAEKIESNTELQQISSKLIVQDNNFIFLSRHHLTYDTDLRSLAALTSKENNLSSSKSVINLDFSLQTPWGIKNIQKTEYSIQPEKTRQQWIWKLKAGNLNHIEVVFWLPNILAFGTLTIILFVWGGFYLKGYLGKTAIQNNDQGIASNE
jgi:hypothetical protein